MYIYLAERDDFSKVPPAVMQGLGNTEFAMTLDIFENSKLARENAVKVLENINSHGFHLQLPAKTRIEDLMQSIASGR